MYARNLDVCGTMYVLPFLICVGAVLQWAVVTTAGCKIIELKAMG